jgi:ubiquinone/menaquinone biosynthesis C-methylase UbiE
MTATNSTAGAERALSLLTADARAEATTTDAGYVETLGPETEPDSTGPAQDLMLTGVVPAIYERWWRPALGRAVKGLTGPGMDEELRIARLLLGLAGGHRVLDVACGPGNFTREFARAVGDTGIAVGLDASEPMLTRAVRDTAKAGHDNVGYVRADVAALPFEAGTFDAVCCFAALHLFADPFAAIGEMTRVLAPGGRIAILTSVRRQLTVPPLKPLVERTSGMRVFEQEEIVSALRMRGYTDVHQRVSGLVQFVGGRLES